jgi:shikimate dehydrogenase
MTDRYAVIGHPIAHSRSPEIHALFARQTGQDLAYERLLAPLDGFRATVEAFRSAGGKGANVTLPFKLQAFELCARRSGRAEAAQACNTLCFDAELYGDNTDGVGLLVDLEANLDFAIAGRRVLLMGAGGAAQGVLGPLVAAAPRALVVGNRTVEKAQRLVRHFSADAGHVNVTLGACGYAELAGSEFDLVVNATSASLDDALPQLPRGVFAAGALAYDMMYGKGLTPFLQLARREGAGRLADGLGMLVEQAAASFQLWRGVRPDTAPVIAQLKAR